MKHYLDQKEKREIEKERENGRSGTSIIANYDAVVKARWSGNRFKTYYILSRQNCWIFFALSLLLKSLKLQAVYK